MQPVAAPLGSLPSALLARQDHFPAFFTEPHTSGLRLFNGFTEGLPGFTVDLYARSLLILDTTQGSAHRLLAAPALEYYRSVLPFLSCAIYKTRQDYFEILFGQAPDTHIIEGGVTYAIDLLSFHDASFFLDTRPLRTWAQTTLAGKYVLNTFAYTGSIGAAAKAAGARRVIQTDMDPRALALAQKTYLVNGWAVDPSDFQVGDFFPTVARLKRASHLFDCIILDPPYFSQTSKGRVDVASRYLQLVNKVRPLVGDGGWLALVNNAVFVPGSDFFAEIETLTSSGYIELETILPVASDFTGVPSTRQGALPVDPAPFNHSTKIAVLRITRKDGRRATQVPSR